jgi:hypothetical protein
MLLVFGFWIIKSPHVFRIMENSHLGGIFALGN